MEDYLEVNKASWNSRLEAHLSSDFYDLEEEEGSYADRNAALKQKFVCWNHGLAKVVISLLDTGMSLNLLKEFDYSPYVFVNYSEEVEPGKFRIKNFGNKAPLVYALEARKI